ncbi:conserved hypothetical protein [Histoplasma capsulatum H143]|uniref:Uncharacterized protein n=1 Tax=Ajellomyces capsulatus (strain H143) TaxID=544712 RepID=C6HK94_AJECH|nr:conserved hypothetical protein [Histoplasma capsulatum H143]
MTDTLITNLSPDALRQMRTASSRTSCSIRQNSATRSQRTRDVHSAYFVSTSHRRHVDPDARIDELRNRICTLLGSGLPFESLQLLAEVVRQSCGLELDDTVLEGESLVLALAAVDGDLVQALTAVQKLAILHDWANGGMPTAQRQVLLRLRTDLENCREQSEGVGGEFGFGRGSVMLESILSQMWE